ncbi:MAG TPA: hypothetical protein VF742_03555, partial [Terracidiphilus sp.]
FGSATGTLTIDARDGVLRHVVLAEGTGPPQIHRLAAHLLLEDGKFKVQEGKLEGSAGIFQLSGTATLTRVLNLTLAREGGQSYDVTGTLTDPHVSPVLTPETRADLKREKSQAEPNQTPDP